MEVNGHLQSSAAFRKEGERPPYKDLSCYDTRPVYVEEGIESLNILESAKNAGGEWDGQGM